MFVNELVECFEVACLLLIHVLHQWSEVRMLAHDGGCLGRVDECGGQFARLIHAEGGGEKVALFFGQRL